MSYPFVYRPGGIIQWLLARPDTSSGGLAHQITKFVWTIEVFAVPVGAGLLCPQLELIGVHLEQVCEVGAASPAFARGGAESKG